MKEIVKVQMPIDMKKSLMTGVMHPDRSSGARLMIYAQDDSPGAGNIGVEGFVLGEDGSIPDNLSGRKWTPRRCDVPRVTKAMDSAEGVGYMKAFMLGEWDHLHKRWVIDVDAGFQQFQPW